MQKTLSPVTLKKYLKLFEEFGLDEMVIEGVTIKKARKATPQVTGPKAIPVSQHIGAPTSIEEIDADIRKKLGLQGVG